MKKIVLILLMTLGLYASGDIVSEECKVDMYYANGIMMQDSDDEARDIWKSRLYTLLKNHPEAYAYIGDVKVAYNLSEGITADLWESFLQKTSEDNTYKVGWFAFKRVLAKIPYTRALRWAIKISELDSKMIEYQTLLKQIEQYKQSIDSGHGVIVVAHSQGNLFTVKAFKKMGDRKDYFHTIAVASPHNEIPNNGHAVTFDNDIITEVPKSYKKTTYNPNRRDIVYYPRNALGEINGPRTLERDVKSIQYHGFEYYLGYETYETILDSGSTGEDAITKSVKMQTDIAKEKIGKWILEEIENNLKRKSCNNNDDGDNSGDNTDDNNTGGDSDNGGGADNGDGSDNGDNNATDPTQDPNKVCLSKYFKYGNGKIIEDLKKGDKDAYNEDTDEGYSDGTKHQVKELQEFLEAFGYDVGTNGADGWFGSDTKSALIEFQKKNSLDADGIVGPNTRKTMNDQKCYDK